MRTWVYVCACKAGLCYLVVIVGNVCLFFRRINWFPSLTFLFGDESRLKPKTCRRLGENLIAEPSLQIKAADARLPSERGRVSVSSDSCASRPLGSDSLSPTPRTDRSPAAGKASEELAPGGKKKTRADNKCYSVGPRFGQRCLVWLQRLLPGDDQDGETHRTDLDLISVTKNRWI